ncbi:MAG: metallophosphoesterase [Thermomicrobiales bacterium]|nr:metallophosphoesterase [Thermomicrobiales bacterium]
MNLKVLAVTDEVDPRIYSSSVRERMGDVDLVISCGDLPATYLEFLTDSLHKDVYYVLGNHAEEIVREGQRGQPRHPLGCIDLGFKVVRDERTGVIFAGLPGSPKYLENAPVQFTEGQMRWAIFKMMPRLIWNRLRYGRALDILVTHAPPRDVGDREDPAHRGFIVMRKLVKWAKPKYQLHGHVHLYDRSKGNATDLFDTRVINVYPYQKLDLVLERLPEVEDQQVVHPDSIRAELGGEEAQHV